MFEKQGKSGLGSVKGASSSSESPLKELKDVYQNSHAKDNSGVEADKSSKRGDLANLPTESGEDLYNVGEKQKVSNVEVLENSKAETEEQPSKRAKLQD